MMMMLNRMKTVMRKKSKMSDKKNKIEKEENDQDIFLLLWSKSDD